MARFIREAMMDQCLQKDEIPESYRFQSVYGHGYVYCDFCGNSWSSHLSWITIDFGRAFIQRIWEQKCASCDQAESMRFRADELIRMIDVALDRCIALMNGRHRSQRGNGLNGFEPNVAGPHEGELCEKCGWGSRRCWTRSR